MQDSIATFEQPLTEPIRLCLRLEQLFEQVLATLKQDNEWGSRTTISAILDVLNVIDRPDLKGKLTKALIQRASKLAPLEQAAEVDQQKLRELLAKLDSLIDGFYANNGVIGYALRKNEFLKIIRQHANAPGGASHFTTPAFHLWLQQPLRRRINDMQTWLKEFEPLHEAIATLLQLTRASSKPQRVIAKCGVYQATLPTQPSYELIRVSMLANSYYFPEISVSGRQQRLSVRFLTCDPHATERAKQAAGDIAFTLNCCAS